MQNSGTFWNILEKFGTFCMHSGTFCTHSVCILHSFMNILHAFWNILYAFRNILHAIWNILEHHGGENFTPRCDHLMCLGVTTRMLHPVPEVSHLGLHLPEGEGKSGEEPQTGDHCPHQVVCEPRHVVKVIQVAPETLSC